jgi:predicted amidohydrolase
MGQPNRTLRVAAAQIAITDDIACNLRVILATIQRQAARGSEVVLFPETALTGYSPAIGHGRHASEWPTIESALATIAQAAQEHGIWVLVGTEAWVGTHWVNRLYAFSDTGQIAAQYDKIHLTRADTQFYQPGTEQVVLDLKGITVGLQICYDVRFPEGYRSLLDQGAEVVMIGFYGAGSGTWKVPVLEAHLRSRAAENGCFVVAANVAGPLQIVVSQVVDPLGLMLAQANQDCAEVVEAELHLDRIADSEIRQDFLSRFRDTRFRDTRLRDSSHDG